MDSIASQARRTCHQLLTLGRLSLLETSGVEDPSLGTRRRKLAVLAYLALRGRPVTRDHLASVFWGSKDDERARNSLSDALSHLRRVLGRDALVTRGDEVSLSSNAPLTIDAVDLSAAVAAQDWPRATALYCGPFLDGVHVDDAPEFEHWSSTEGERLRRLFTRACSAHARALAKDGRWEECADLAARWLAAEPASGEAALYRLNALKAPGTHEALVTALSEYERLRGQLADSLGVGVDPAVERLAEAIRSELPPIVASNASSAPAAAPPRLQSAAEPSEPATTVRPIPIGHVNQGPGARLRRTRTLAGVSILLLCTIGVVAAYDRQHSTDESTPILAVLPFENVGAAADEYFADGLTDEVRARLTAISGLRVIGGMSTRQYRGTTKSPREVARELGATHLLTGSVRWDRSSDGNGRVRVSAELIRATDQSNLWAEPLDGKIEDVFGMQAEVAERAASALNVTLLAREQRDVTTRSTTNLAAYDAYLRARTSLATARSFSAVDRQVSLREFQRAVALDPAFAAAHAEIARIHWLDYSQAGDSAAAAVALSQFRSAAERAWALDTGLVAARLIRARYLELAGDWTGAERLIRATARAAPGDVAVLSALARVESRAGKYEAAIAAYRRAMALDPRAGGSWVDLAGLLDRLYRYEEAIAVREHEIEVTPTLDAAYVVQASSHVLWRGDTATARRTLERGSLTLPWAVRLPGGVAGITIWNYALPPGVLHARDTLTMNGYLAEPGGIAPELYHLVKLRHYLATGRAQAARAHADSLVVRIEPALRAGNDAPWFFWWFSRRSVLAEAYATLGRNADAATEVDAYVAETRQRRVALPGRDPEQLCHALHNGAYVDALIGRKALAVARLTEALQLPCGHRVSRPLLRTDPAWSPLHGLPAFERLISSVS